MMRILCFKPCSSSRMVCEIRRSKCSSTMPSVCHRSSPSSNRSRSDKANGSAKARTAVPKLIPCLRKLLATFSASPTRSACPYDYVTTSVGKPGVQGDGSKVEDNVIHRCSSLVCCGGAHRSLSNNPSLLLLRIRNPVFRSVSANPLNARYTNEPRKHPSMYLYGVSPVV